MKKCLWQENFRGIFLAYFSEFYGPRNVENTHGRKSSSNKALRHGLTGL